jgi:uncharacterized protein (TIGR02145 family)
MSIVRIISLPEHKMEDIRDKGAFLPVAVAEFEKGVWEGNYKVGLDDLCDGILKEAKEYADDLDRTKISPVGDVILNRNIGELTLLKNNPDFSFRDWQLICDKDGTIGYIIGRNGDDYYYIPITTSEKIFLELLEALTERVGKNEKLLAILLSDVEELKKSSDDSLLKRIEALEQKNYDDTELWDKIRELEDVIERLRKLFGSVTGMFSIMVHGGEASHVQAYDGTPVTITYSGSGDFRRWDMEPAVTFTSGSKDTPAATFAMPKQDVIAKAVEVYSITVENGYAEPNEAEAGDIVELTAVEPATSTQSVAKPSLKTSALSVAQLPPVSKLYTLQEAIAATPEGWHVPTREEWETLFAFAGENAGKKLKATNGWNEDGNGTDDYGFNALPENYNDTGYVYGTGTNAIWWSSSPRLDEEGNEVEGKIAVYGLYYESDFVAGYDFDDTPSLSLRLVKDDGVMPPDGIFTDPRDGKTYSCVKIGEQVWMAENLNYAEVQNG